MSRTDGASTSVPKVYESWKDFAKVFLTKCAPRSDPSPSSLDIVLQLRVGFQAPEQSPTMQASPPPPAQEQLPLEPNLPKSGHGVPEGGPSPVHPT